MMYHTWRVSELKKRGASLRGRKTDLIERLECYDKNFNFGAENLDNNDEPAMVLAANEAYRDINSHTILPPLNKTQIRHYLSYTNKKMDKVVQLYESRHLVAARSHIFNSYTYLKGICRKTMKSLHYEINIKLDEYGNIEEAHCECPAGSGNSASCKHVAVLLFAVEHMVNEKNILLFESCTQKLQQFHAPRNPYTGTPVRAEKLLRKKGSVIYEPYALKKIDKQNYNSRVRSLSSTGWHAERKIRLTASNFHTICHSKPTTLPSYAKQILHKKTFQSRATTHGIINEPIAMKTYCDHYDLEVVPCGLFISKEKPYLAASPDGLLGLDTTIEIKCPYASRFQPINSTTVPYLTSDLTLKTTSPYYYQVQGQLYCTQRKYCNFIVYTYKDMKVVYIPRDEAFIQNILTNLDNFYEVYFKRELLNKYLFNDYESFKK